LTQWRQSPTSIEGGGGIPEIVGQTLGPRIAIGAGEIADERVMERMVPDNENDNRHHDFWPCHHLWYKEGLGM
jgi:hypothetical protein